MNNQVSRKRMAGTDGMKALIATASVAATLVGWALLPANDPQASASTQAPQAQQPALGAPGSFGSDSPGGFNSQFPDNSGGLLPQQQVPASGSQLPSVNLPSRSLRGFSSTHSSR